MKKSDPLKRECDRSAELNQQRLSLYCHALVLHSGGLHHRSDGRISPAAEEEEEALHPHCLLHLLHHRLLEHHAGINEYRTSGPLYRGALVISALSASVYCQLPREVCMCSSCLITTPPAGCASSSSSSSKPFPSPGFTVGDLHHVACASAKPCRETERGQLSARPPNVSVCNRKLHLSATRSCDKTVQSASPFCYLIRFVLIVIIFMLTRARFFFVLLALCHRSRKVL